MKTPSLPTIRDLPRAFITDSCVGYVISKVSGVPALLTTLIFSIRSVVKLFFYHIINYSFKKRDLDSHKVYIGVSLAVDMTFLVALRELGLISQLASIAFGTAILGYLSNRVIYVDDIEKEEARQLNQT